MRAAALGGALVVLALAFASAAEARTIHVRSDGQFAKAERALSRSGGKIVLHAHLYRKLVVKPRSRRLLRIVGTRGARVQSLIFEGTQRVSFGRARIGPITRNALVQIWGSRDVVLHDLFVSARRTRLLGLGSDSGLAPRHDQAQQLHALRRSRARVRQLRDALPLVARRRDRGQLVPRLLRLRLRPRPLRHRPDDPREPLRARTAVRDGPLPVRAPGSRPALRRAAAARRGQPLRHLPRRRRPALPDEQRRLRDDCEQRLRRHGRARARVPRADGDRARQQQVEAAAALREDPQQHDPDRLPAAGRLRGVTADELAVRRRAALEAAGRREQRDRVAGDARPRLSRRAAVPGERRRPRAWLLAVRPRRLRRSRLARPAGDRLRRHRRRQPRPRPGRRTRRDAGADARRTSARSSIGRRARTARAAAGAPGRRHRPDPRARRAGRPRECPSGPREASRRAPRRGVWSRPCRRP